MYVLISQPTYRRIVKARLCSKHLKGFRSSLWFKPFEQSSMLVNLVYVWSMFVFCEVKLTATHVGRERSDEARS